MSDAVAGVAPVQPLLSHLHPLTYGSRDGLQERMASVFPSLATAPAGAPVGFSVTLIHARGIPFSMSEIGVLTADASEGIKDISQASDFVGRPGYEDLVTLALKVPPKLLDLDELDMKDFWFAESSPSTGYHMRTLWILPTTALLLDNIQGVCIDEAKYLPSLAIPFYVRPSTQHERLIRCQEINRLMSLARTKAVPSVIEDWPAGYRRDEIDFAPITPAHLEMMS